MFQIGEFSKIAQVSGRQLRHYDKLGLLKPARIDPESGYRYYSAKQLPRLNRILALKELGLSLDQISRLLNEDISGDEIRGMLMMKKAQVEQTLREEMSRFRVIESRIEQIETEGELKDYDIVLKSIPKQFFLSVRKLCDDIHVTRALSQEIHHLLPARVESKYLGYFTAVLHSDMFDPEALDIEMGFLLNEPIDTTVPLQQGLEMTVRELPAIDTMLTSVRVGPFEEAHACYSAMGVWAEENGYQFDGKGREVFLKLAPPDRAQETVCEIQYPVQKIESERLFLSE